jgi:hypothetical protein
MEKDNYLELFNDRQKAIDQAMWLNFLHRTKSWTFGVVQSVEGGWFVTERSHPSFEESDFDSLPKDSVDMDYNHIKRIAMDTEPLEHWEEIKGMFAVVNGDTLRFILHYRVPLERFIRFELAARGYDKDHNWCGFEKAKEIWINE